MSPKKRQAETQSVARVVGIMLTRDLLDQAVFCLAVGSQDLQQRLDRSSVPLATLRRADLETEAEMALFARVQLGLSQLRGARLGDDEDDERDSEVPVFALEATASHIVDLRDATTRRLLRAVARASGDT